MNRSVTIIGLTLLTLLAPPGLLSAQPAAAKNTANNAAEKVASIEGITEYRFSNGLRFLSFPDPAASTVTVNMTVLVGSRHEGYGETGMAHLLEHMLFKGSKNFPHVDKSMQAHGANFNGTTWVDRTNYYETMPASAENLEFALRLEADRLLHSFIRREDLASEMTVVRSEFEMGENSPERVLNQRMMAVAYEWHNYGKSTIGNRTDIERVPIANLQEFYKKHYQVDNVVLIVAGKFDAAKALVLVTEHFGGLKAPARKLVPTYTEEPAQDGERVVTLRRVGKVPVVGTMYHIPAAAHEDTAPLDVLSTILGDTPSGRLYKNLVLAKKATKVAGDATGWHDPGILDLTAFANDGVAPEEVRAAMIDAAENLSKKPATKGEVERAVRKYLSAREQAMSKSNRIALELSEWAAAGDWRLLFVHRDRIAKVTPDDVNRVAAKYLRPSNRTVGMFVPSTEVARTPVPETPNVAKLVKDYKGGKALASGEAFDPTPENLDKRIIRKTLSNGLKVVLLPKGTRGESVVGRLTLHFGNEKSLHDYHTSSDFLGALMLRGTKKHSRQEIQDELDKLTSRLSVSSGLGQLSVGLESKREQLPALFDLLREVLREPTFPADEFLILQRNQKQNLEKSLVEPTALAVNKLGRALSPYPVDNIRYRPTIQEAMERVEKVKRDDVKKLYDEQLGGNHGELALVGDFDPDAMLQQLETIFADWKSPVPYERVKYTLVAGVKGAKEAINTPDKENAFYLAGHTFAMTDLDPEYPALSLGNYILGTGFTSRLIDRLRQKEGVSYSAASMIRVGSEDKVATFMLYAIANPTNIDKVDQGALEEVNKLLKSGVTTEELSAAQRGYLEELKTDRGSDAKLAGMMRENAYLGRTFEYYADLEKKIAALTPADVSRALGQHLNAGRLVIIRAGDFARKTLPAPMK